MKCSPSYDTGRIASLAGFLVLTHVFERPRRYGASVRFDTIPSSPNPQTCVGGRFERWVKMKKHPTFALGLVAFG